MMRPFIRHRMDNRGIREEADPLSAAHQHVSGAKNGKRSDQEPVDILETYGEIN